MEHPGSRRPGIIFLLRTVAVLLGLAMFVPAGFLWFLAVRHWPTAMKHSVTTGNGDHLLGVALALVLAAVLAVFGLLCLLLGRRCLPRRTVLTVLLAASAVTAVILATGPVVAAAVIVVDSHVHWQARQKPERLTTAEGCENGHAGFPASRPGPFGVP